MPNTLYACPICGTVGKKNTLCESCRWFLIGSLDAVSLTPIPENELSEINATLQGYRQAWMGGAFSEANYAGRAAPPPENTDDRRVLALLGEIAELEARNEELEHRLAEERAKCAMLLHELQNKVVNSPSARPIDPKQYKMSGGRLLKYLGYSRTLSIPEGVTSIAPHAFASHSYLTNLTIPDSVRDIGDYAFSGCSALKSVQLSSGLAAIGERAFADCVSLEEIFLPDSLTTMEKAAFSGCSKLKRVRIPKNLFKIPDEAFAGCLQLQSVSIPKSTHEIGLHAFEPRVNKLFV